MEERRKDERFTAKLPARLEAIMPGRKNVLYLATKDISAAGAFIYTMELFPKGTQFILDFTIPKDSINELPDVKSIMECTIGSMVWYNSEGMAIHFDRECYIMSLRGS
jgi:hypothetical protein